MNHPYHVTLTLVDCVYFIAQIIGASHFKRQAPVRWTAYKMADDKMLTCSIRFIGLSNEMFNISTWRKGKLPDDATII